MLEQENISQKSTTSTRILWWLSASNKEVLEDIDSVKIKYQILGFTVLITAIFASITSAYAINFVYDNLVIAGVFGIFWGFVILNIDRLLIVSINKSQNPIGQFLWTIPRVLLAIFIALLISKPFELAIFKNEINIFQKNIIEEKKKLNQLIEEAKRLGTELEKSSRDAKNEALGQLQEGSRAEGFGPITTQYNHIRDNIQLEFESINKEKERLKNNLNIFNDITYFIEGKGVVTQLAILSALKKSNQTVFYVDLLLSLLFIILELLPILTKSFSKKNNYDIKLEELESKEKENFSSSLIRKMEDKEKFSTLKQTEELSFITDLYTRLITERKKKTEDIFSNWTKKDDRTFDELLQTLSSEFSQNKIENIGNIKTVKVDRKPSFKIKFPKVKKEIIRPFFTGLLAGGVWLFMIYMLNNHLSNEDFKLGIFITIGLTISSWIFYNSEQKVQEEFKDKIKSATVERVLSTSVFTIGTLFLAIIVKYSFDIQINNPQQIMEIAFAGTFAKATADSILV